MRITKFGHCCLLLEIGGVRILTDPGTMSSGERDLERLDAIVITHEHSDHFHIESVKAIRAKNPEAVVITNVSVGALLAKESIPFAQIGDGERGDVKGISVEGFGREHAVIYQQFGAVENTGFMIGGTFYFPGDSFYDPKRPVDILALPVAGPWMKISEAIDFAKALKPRAAFPVHDGILRPESAGFAGQMGQALLGPSGITFISLMAGETKEL